MLSVFVPVVLACASEVRNPAEDCRVFFGGTFLTEQNCVTDITMNGLPHLQQILPEGGSIEDMTCLELQTRKGSNL